MAVFVGKMGEVYIQGCISKHMMCIEVDKGFKGIHTSPKSLFELFGLFE